MAEGEQDRDTGAEGTPPSSTDRPRPRGFRDQLRDVAREHRGPSIIAALLLLVLLVVAVGGTGLAIWAFREEGVARRAEQQAVQKEKKAEDVAAEYKTKFQQSEATWKAAAQELRYAQGSAEAARHSEQDMKDVLDFFKKTLLSAGRPGGGTLPAAFWAAGRGQDVMLRQALDLTESRVAEMFADRPLAEAAIRELIGLGYLNVGEPARAVQQYRRTLDLREAIQGAAHPDAAACRNQLAVAYRLAGRPTEAALLFDRTPNTPGYAAALAARGLTLLLEKKPAEAELKLRECLTIRRKIQPGDWTTFDTESALGEALVDQKKFAEAEPLLRSGYEGLKQRKDAIPSQERSRLTRALERLVKFYEAQGQEDQAARWRKELEGARATAKS
jgi:hypothetical protein